MSVLEVVRCRQPCPAPRAPMFLSRAPLLRGSCAQAGPRNSSEQEEVNQVETVLGCFTATATSALSARAAATEYSGKQPAVERQDGTTGGQPGGPHSPAPHPSR